MTTINRVAPRGVGHASGAISADNPAIAIGKCAGIWIQNSDINSDRVLLYLHAGGSRCCGLDSHQRLLARISGALEASVLVLDYRSGREYPISDGVDDAVGCYQRLLAAGYHRDHIVLAVDSADNDMAIMVPMAIRECQLPAPASVVAISPLLDGAEFLPQCALIRSNQPVGV